MKSRQESTTLRHKRVCLHLDLLVLEGTLTSPVTLRTTTTKKKPVDRRDDSIHNGYYSLLFLYCESSLLDSLYDKSKRTFYGFMVNSL